MEEKLIVIGDWTHTYTEADTNGIYIDTLFNAASNGCDSIVTTSLTVITGINTASIQNTNAKIFPNPFTTSTSITVSYAQFTEGELVIYDL